MSRKKVDDDYDEDEDEDDFDDDDLDSDDSDEKNDKPSGMLGTFMARERKKKPTLTQFNGFEEGDDGTVVRKMKTILALRESLGMDDDMSFMAEQERKGEEKKKLASMSVEERMKYEEGQAGDVMAKIRARHVEKQKELEKKKDIENESRARQAEIDRRAKLEQQAQLEAQQAKAKADMMFAKACAKSGFSSDPFADSSAFSSQGWQSPKKAREELEPIRSPVESDLKVKKKKSSKESDDAALRNPASEEKKKKKKKSKDEDPSSSEKKKSKDEGASSSEKKVKKEKKKSKEDSSSKDSERRRRSSKKVDAL